MLSVSDESNGCPTDVEAPRDFRDRLPGAEQFANSLHALRSQLRPSVAFTLYARDSAPSDD
jgi:hypothetical protein